MTHMQAQTKKLSAKKSEPVYIQVDKTISALTFNWA